MGLPQPRNIKQFNDPGLNVTDPVYFASNQALLFLGEALIDEVVSIQYQLNNSKVPVYGYNSEYYSVAARGKILVQGQLVLNYIDPDYLTAAITNYFSSKSEKLRKKISDVSKTGMTGGYLNPLLHNDKTPFPTQLESRNKDLLVKDFLTNERVLENQILKSFSQRIAADPASAKSIIQEYKKKFWKKAEADNRDRAENKSSYPNTGAIHHSFGASNSDSVDLLSDFFRSRPDQLRPFNIVVYHGLPSNPYSLYRILVDVDLTSVGQAITMTSDNQLESYSFIAKNLI